MARELGATELVRRPQGGRSILDELWKAGPVRGPKKGCGRHLKQRSAQKATGAWELRDRYSILRRHAHIGGRPSRSRARTGRSKCS
ncbi:hypothetical protein J6590_016943 [Homalodisca vitripennis]|nr:hypothetical protein J6590_016943 [Homalodisca vitripennis]